MIKIISKVAVIGILLGVLAGWISAYTVRELDASSDLSPVISKSDKLLIYEIDIAPILINVSSSNLKFIIWDSDGVTKLWSYELLSTTAGAYLAGHINFGDRPIRSTSRTVYVQVIPDVYTSPDVLTTVLTGGITLKRTALPITLLTMP